MENTDLYEILICLNFANDKGHITATLDENCCE